jgi:hypothetical protein
MFSKRADFLSIPGVVFVLFHVKHAAHVDDCFGLLCADVPGERTEPATHSLLVSRETL